MEIFIVYSAKIKTAGFVIGYVDVDDYDEKYHDCIEIEHVNKTLEGAKEWVTNTVRFGQLEPYNRSEDDACFNETPIWEVRGDPWVFFIIKKHLH